eukprot:scaffold211442_cov33-Tisochrysis_lutea.AAC.3
MGTELHLNAKAKLACARSKAPRVSERIPSRRGSRRESRPPQDNWLKTPHCTHSLEEPRVESLCDNLAWTVQLHPRCVLLSYAHVTEAKCGVEGVIRVRAQHARPRAKRHELSIPSHVSHDREECLC